MKDKNYLKYLQDSSTYYGYGGHKFLFGGLGQKLGNVVSSVVGQMKSTENNPVTSMLAQAGIGASSGLGGLGGSINNMIINPLGKLMNPNGNTTGAGKVMNAVGNVASMIPGVGGVVGAAVNHLGNIVNAAFGSNLNKEFIRETKADAQETRGFSSVAGTNEALAKDFSWQDTVTKDQVGTDGWFSDKAKNETQRLNDLIMEANAMKTNQLGARSATIQENQTRNALMNNFAYGGYINDNNIYSPFSYPSEIREWMASKGHQKGDGGTFASRFVDEENKATADTIWSALQMVPFIGNIIGAVDVVNDIYNMAKSDDLDWSDWGNLALDAASIIPGVNTFTKAAKVAKGVKAMNTANKLQKAADALAFTSPKGVKQIKGGVQKAQDWNKRSTKAAERASRTENYLPIGDGGKVQATRAYEAAKFTEGVLSQVNAALNPTAVYYNTLRHKLRGSDRINDLFGFMETSNVPLRDTDEENVKAEGGGIHIKKKNRGKFTAAAKRAGMGVQEYARHVLANKDRYSSTLVKRANFARNASKWHNYGGFLDDDDYKKQYGRNIEAHELKIPSGLDNVEELSEDQRYYVYNTYDPSLRFLDFWVKNRNPKKVRRVENYEVADKEQEAMWAAYLNLPQDIYEETSNRRPNNLDNDLKGTFIGTTPVMDRAIQTIADTLNLGKLARLSEEEYAKLQQQDSNLYSQNIVKKNYKKSKEILDNPYNWIQVKDSNVSYSSPYNNPGLLQLQNFGIMWDPKNQKLHVHDTYDFPGYVRILGGIPDRENPLYIRGSINFDPNKGSKLLRNLSNNEIKSLGGKIHNSKGVNSVNNNGVNIVNTGGTHEQNPYEGVQMGIAPDGQPNLVEEDEVIWNDYVFSNRLTIPKEMKEHYKYKHKTFADEAKDAQKESEERPNDPISMNGLEAAMGRLQAVQEFTRQQEDIKNRGRRFDDGGRFVFDARKYSYDPDYYYGVSPALMPRYIPIDDFNTWENRRIERDPKQFPVYSYQDFEIVPGDWGTTRDLGKALEGFDNAYSIHNSSLLTDHLWLPIDTSTKDSTIYNNPSVESTPESTTSRTTIEEPIENTSSRDAEERYRINRSITPMTANETLLSPLTTEDTSTYKRSLGDPEVGEEDIVLLDEPTSSSGTDRKGINLLRLAPVIDSGIQTIVDQFSSPDYSLARDISNARRQIRDVGFTPMGGHMGYTPYDRSYLLNKINQQNAATNRAIVNNSGGNAAAAQAGLIAANYNQTNALGDALMRMDQMNEQRKMAIAQHNAEIDQYNSQGQMKADATNRELDLQRANLAVQAAQAREAIRAREEARRTANRNAFITNLGALGSEMEQRGWLNELIDSGAIRAASGYCKGGKLRKKKGGRHA